ncbi:hypothetical protein PAPYR_1040 [Paratrimastix pyriformis]|uniref:Uncharacterized protein n=1 Tax=Paratrimastix pyriformis TaxID=342808 RepID=A0ABQ8UVI3_9EUKA|nr:hypothetical protein PAPYR_1040 [Paratrimastix pyriformis]
MSLPILGKDHWGGRRGTDVVGGQKASKIFGLHAGATLHAIALGTAAHTHPRMGSAGNWAGTTRRGWEARAGRLDAAAVQWVTRLYQERPSARLPPTLSRGGLGGLVFNVTVLELSAAYLSPFIKRPVFPRPGPCCSRVLPGCSTSSSVWGLGSGRHSTNGCHLGDAITDPTQFVPTEGPPRGIFVVRRHPAPQGEPSTGRREGLHKDELAQHEREYRVPFPLGRLWHAPSSLSRARKDRSQRMCSFQSRMAGWVPSQPATCALIAVSSLGTSARRWRLRQEDERHSKGDTTRRVHDALKKDAARQDPPLHPSFAPASSHRLGSLPRLIASSLPRLTAASIREASGEEEELAALGDEGGQSSVDRNIPPSEDAEVLITAFEPNFSIQELRGSLGRQLAAQLQALSLRDGLEALVRALLAGSRNTVIFQASIIGGPDGCVDNLRGDIRSLVAPSKDHPGRPIAVADLEVWCARLTTGDLRSTCPARALVGLLKCPAVTGRPTVLACLLFAVAGLCTGPSQPAARARTALCRAGVAAPLVGLFRPPTLVATNTKVAANLLMAIGNLALDDPTCSALGGAGAVAPLAQLLRTTTDPVVAFPLLYAIGNLTQGNPENYAAFTRADTIPSLVRLLRDHPGVLGESNVGSEFFRAVGNLACDNGTRGIFGRAGVADPLVELLRLSNPALITISPTVAHTLFLAIANLVCDNPENRTAFGRAGVVGPLVELLRRSTPALVTASPDAAMELFRAIGNLSNGHPGNSAAFGRAGIVPLVADLLRSRPTLITAQPKVLHQLLRTVPVLIEGSTENSIAFGRAGVVGPLVDMLRGYPGLIAASPEVALQLISAIANLSCNNPENASAFDQAGVAVPLVGLLTASPAAVPALAHISGGTTSALSCFWNLAGSKTPAGNRNLEAFRRIPATRFVIQQLAAACPAAERPYLMLAVGLLKLL